MTAVINHLNVISLEKAGLSSTIRLIQISHKPCKFPPDKMVCFGTLEEIRE